MALGRTAQLRDHLRALPEAPEVACEAEPVSWPGRVRAVSGRAGAEDGTAAAAGEQDPPQVRRPR